jgi:glucokinase
MIAVFCLLVNRICAILCAMNYFIAVDIGGTQIRAACYPEDKQSPKTIKRISTQGSDSTPLERLIHLLESIWPEGNVAGVGVAAPGPLDPFQGIVIEAPNIPGWVNMPLQHHLEEQFNTPVALGNDANLAALGEWKYGAGRGFHHLIYITVSTGIGGGVIIDDRLLLGERGLAAELGHVTILPDGPICSCGQPGHVEAMASGPALARWAQQEIQNGSPSILPVGKDVTAKDIGEAAKQGDQVAIAALARSGYYLGLALANYCQIFNPSAIIIGGGVSQTGHFLFGPLKTALSEHVMSSDYMKNLTISTAALGDDVGLMGALALAQSLK